MERTKNALQHTMQCIAETKAELKNEHVNHSNTVEELKSSIKQTKADVTAMKDNTYAAAVEARASLAEQRSASENDMQTKKKEIQAEIDGLKAKLSKDEAIHNDKIHHLENEIQELKQKKVDVEIKTSAEMAMTESELQLLTEELFNNKAVLELEERLKEEEAEQKKIEEQEAIRLQEEANANALREKQHYAALWIQLRWKAFFKKKMLNQQKKKGRGSNGKKKRSKN